MNQISGTIPTDAPAQAQGESAPESTGAPAPPADAPPTTEPTGSAPEHPGFQSRGRARRRARFLRKARELAYRDLGGLVFNLHRFGARNDALVLAKLSTLTQIDTELRAIEGALGERRALTVLREAGITACPRCAAIHGSEDNFCPNCGLSMGRHVDLPIGGAAAAQPVSAPPSQPSPPAAAPSSPSPAAPVAHAAPASTSVAAATAQPEPAHAPVPAHPPAATGAPQPASAAPAGRSPTPPANAETGGRSPLTPAPAASTADEEATEILHPPVPGS